MLSGTFTPKTIIAKGCGTRRPATIASGLQLAAGTVLGKVTASGLYVAYSSGASDGSQKAVGILLQTIDTTAAGYGGAAESAMLVGGATVYYDQLVGVDEDAISDLGGRLIEANLLYLP